MGSNPLQSTGLWYCPTQDDIQGVNEWVEEQHDVPQSQDPSDSSPVSATSQVTLSVIYYWISASSFAQ